MTGGISRRAQIHGASEWVSEWDTYMCHSSEESQLWQSQTPYTNLTDKTQENMTNFHPHQKQNMKSHHTIFCEMEMTVPVASPWTAGAASCWRITIPLGPNFESNPGEGPLACHSINFDCGCGAGRGGYGALKFDPTTVTRFGPGNRPWAENVNIHKLIITSEAHFIQSATYPMDEHKVSYLELLEVGSHW
jgi:hypothetical protein